jgi:transposase
MATTSFIYHTLGLAHYKHLKTEYRNGAVYHHVKRKDDERYCAGCHARWPKLIMDGRFQRIFLALPIGRRHQYVVLHGHEQNCSNCGKTLREPIPFAKGKRQRLKAFDRCVVELCQIATIKHVAQFLSLGWDTVKEIFKEHLEHRFQKRKLKKVRHIAIDEFSIRKNHQYMTVVLDLDSGEILYVNEGKDANAVLPFLYKLKRKRAKLSAVAIDMSPAYIKAVRQVFPQVDIVHDPYHVVALVNDAIDATRRDMARNLSGPDRECIKGSRFLLLKGNEKLSLKSRQWLTRLMELNEPLYQAYLLKEDLRMFWSSGSEEQGRHLLETWIDQAKALNIRHFTKLAETLDQHRQGLLNYFAHYISTAPLEGMNNKIKTLKRQAYGFRDNWYFKLRLYFIHESIPAFPG